MHLREFLYRVGDQEAARLFCKKRYGIRAWRLGYRYPRRNECKEIFDLTQGHPAGEVSTYDEIYSDFEPSVGKRG